MIKKNTKAPDTVTLEIVLLTVAIGAAFWNNSRPHPDTVLAVACAINSVCAILLQAIRWME